MARNIEQELDALMRSIEAKQERARAREALSRIDFLLKEWEERLKRDSSGRFLKSQADLLGRALHRKDFGEAEDIWMRMQEGARARAAAREAARVKPRNADLVKAARRVGGVPILFDVGAKVTALTEDPRVKHSPRRIPPDAVRHHLKRARRGGK